MRKAIFYSLLLCVLVGGLSVSEAKSQVIRQVVERMDKHYKALQTLQANVDRATFDSVLKEESPYSGKVVLVPGKGRAFKMRLDWVKPRTEVLSVVNGQYVMFVPGINRAYFGSSESKTVNSGGGSVLSVLNMSQTELRANYESPIMLSEKATLKDGTQTFHLKLVPKTKNKFQFAEIWVDPDGMPRQVKITNNNNDTDTIYLSAVKKNATINSSIFKVDVGKAERIKQ